MSCRPFVLVVDTNIINVGAERMMWHPERQESRILGWVGEGLRSCSCGFLDHTPSLYKEHLLLCLLTSDQVFISTTISLPLPLPLSGRQARVQLFTIIVKWKMKMSRATMKGSKKKMSCSCRSLGGYLREQKGRLYIIRRCIVMLLCWHD